MLPTTEEVGRRIRAVRESCGMTQAQVADVLGVSRPTLTQIELGNRTVSSLELEKLAYLFGRDARDFLAAEFEESDALVMLYRAEPEAAEKEQVAEALKHCLALAREVSNIERLLGPDRDLTHPAAYDLPEPRSKWDAIRQGKQAAMGERQRLGLGEAPIGRLTEVLEEQGIRTAQHKLTPEISGVTVRERRMGFLVVVNAAHNRDRRRFSYAHEYAHVLLDSDRAATISHVGNRTDLREVRANSFAAHFLMPEAAIQDYVTRLGKGRPSRSSVEIIDAFEEKAAVRAEGRTSPGSQDLQLYDLVRIAEFFGTSVLATLYRLRNVRPPLLTEKELQHFKEINESGKPKELAIRLDLTSFRNDEDERRESRDRFMALALEAYRREAISRGKLIEVGRLAGFSNDAVSDLIALSGIEQEDAEGEVLVPDG